MRCIASFILAGPHERDTKYCMDCREAAGLMENFHSPSSKQYYIKNASIRVGGALFRDHIGFELLSQRQFKCLLNCASLSKKNEFSACKISCLREEDFIDLNLEDRIKYKG